MLKEDQPIKVKKFYKIPPYSKKRASQNKEYSKNRTEFLSANTVCQARLLPGCTYNSTEIHHKAGRVGDKLNDVYDFLAVCRHCHQHIELHPDWAKIKGFSKERT